MKLQAYIFRQLLVAFLMAVSGILLVALPGIAVSTVHRMPFADSALLLRYLPLVLNTLAPYALPICFLLAVVSTYGRLAADREWTAIQMAGIHPWKMLIPGLVLATGLAGLTYWMVSYDLPHSKRQQRELLKDVASLSLKSLKPGRTTLQFGKFYLFARSRDAKDQNILYDVHIRKPDENGGETIDVFADKVHVSSEGDWLMVRLYGGRTASPNAGLQARQEYLEFGYSLKELVGEGGSVGNHPGYLTSENIRAELAAGVDDKHRRTMLDFELQYRMAMASIYLVFLGVGAPTGILLRKGTQLGALAVAIGFGLVYYILSVELGRDMGRSGKVEPWIGAWFVPILGTLSALVMMHRSLKR